MRNLPLGVADIFAGACLWLGIWLGLSPRSWWVHGVGSVVSLALLLIGVALVTGFPWAFRVARWVSWGVLSVGASLVTALAWTVSYLAGVYGPVGQGGALILAVVALLLLPYLVVLPAVHVVALRPRRQSAGP